MSGLSDLLSIGASGTKAYQTALSAVSENIANATTQGYNRRVVRTSESPSSSATSTYYKAGVNFGGVNVASIDRQTDPYLDLAARVAVSNYEDANQRATWNSDIENALDDSSLGVGQRLSDAFTSIDALAANPTDITRRNNVLFALQKVNDSFSNAHAELSNIKTGINTGASNEVVALNDALTRLASVNDALRRAVAGSANQAELFDERDNALNDISTQLDVTVTFKSQGAADVTYNGVDIVQGLTHSTFSVTQNSDGTLNYAIDGTATATPQSGRLAGLAVSGANLADRFSGLNALAQQYVTDFNGWNANGTTASGTAGGALLSIGADASTLQVVTSNPADIAAASSDGTINGNLVAVGTIRQSSGVENGWTQLVAAQANLTSASLAEKNATSARNQQAQQARSAVSGVDLDREAADLLRLQQAYQASARVIQVAREISQTIFQIF